MIRLGVGRKDLANREPVNCAVDVRLNRALIELSKSTNIPKSRLLDKAIEEYLKKNKVKY